MTSRSVSSTRLSGSAMRVTLTPPQRRTTSSHAAAAPLRRPLDRGGAHHAVAVVHHRRLARCDPAGDVMKTYDERPGLDIGGAPQRRAVRAQLCKTFERQQGDRATPRRRACKDGRDVEQVDRTDRHGVGHRRHVQHIPRLAITSGYADAESAALTHGEGISTVVAADDVAEYSVHDRSWLRAQPLLQNPAGVAV